ncbi:hypothetical protein D5066_18645 [Enterobacter chuandaensis]|nr:hypothetical protein D5066_18645 [Enterobacter chuandaensis]
MQMVSICVCITYADVRHMDMHDLYAFFSFSAEIRKKVKSDLQTTDGLFWLTCRTWKQGSKLI